MATSQNLHEDSYSASGIGPMGPGNVQPIHSQQSAMNFPGINSTTRSPSEAKPSGLNAAGMKPNKQRYKGGNQYQGGYYGVPEYQQRAWKGSDKVNDELNELIKCMVCGDTSTGFHYGIHSCEGCKGFFRRSLNQHESYTCSNNGQCEISLYTRNQCQLCRWKKCLGVGMSKDGSRLGRRSKRMIEKMHETIAKQRNQNDITAKPAGFYSNHPDLFAQAGKYGPSGLPPGGMNHPGGHQGAMLGHHMPPGMGGMPMGGMGAMYAHPSMAGGMGGFQMAAMLGGDGQVNPQVVMDHMRSISTIIKQELEQGGHERDSSYNDASTPPEGSPPPGHSRRSSVTGCPDSCGSNPMQQNAMQSPTITSLSTPPFRVGDPRGNGVDLYSAVKLTSPGNNAAQRQDSSPSVAPSKYDDDYPTYPYRPETIPHEQPTAMEVDETSYSKLPMSTISKMLRSGQPVILIPKDVSREGREGDKLHKDVVIPPSPTVVVVDNQKEHEADMDDRDRDDDEKSTRSESRDSPSSSKYMHSVSMKRRKSLEEFNLPHGKQMSFPTLQGHGGQFFPLGGAFPQGMSPASFLPSHSPLGSPWSPMAMSRPQLAISSSFMPASPPHLTMAMSPMGSPFMVHNPSKIHHSGGPPGMDRKPNHSPLNPKSPHGHHRSSIRSTPDPGDKSDKSLPSPSFSPSLHARSPSSPQQNHKPRPIKEEPGLQDEAKLDPAPRGGMLDFNMDEPITPEMKAKLQKIIHDVNKVYHDTCHYTFRRIKFLRDRYFPHLGQDEELNGRLHSKYDHDCSKCDPPPGFPTSLVPPRELDPSEGPIDGQKMWTFFSNKFTSQITRIVNFSKMIPGFKQLDREDQITLIKTGLFEVLTIRFSTVVDVATNTVHWWTTGDTFSLIDAHKMPMGNLFDLLFDFGQRVNRMMLDDSEYALMSAVVIMSADRPGLKNRKLIREVQLDLLKALQLEISDNHPDDDQLFARLLTTIPKLREISPEHTRRLMDLKIRQPGVSFPPLHAEIFDLDSKEENTESS